MAWSLASMITLDVRKKYTDGIVRTIPRGGLSLLLRCPILMLFVSMLGVLRCLISFLLSLRPIHGHLFFGPLAPTFLEVDGYSKPNTVQNALLRNIRLASLLVDLRNNKVLIMVTPLARL
jgi:hypothetical protein